MPTYAKNTTVSPEKSRMEIEQTLMRYGATSFIYMRRQDSVVFGFEMMGRRIKMEIKLPDPDDTEFRYTSNRRRRTSDAQAKAHEQAVRQKYRALFLVIKAKLESVESEIATFEEEFMPFIMLPSGQTVGEVMLPQIARSYETGEMPPLLPERIQ